MMMAVRHMAAIGDAALVYPGLATYGRTVAGKGEYTVRAISVKDLGGGRIATDGLEEIRVPHASDAERYGVHPGDVLVAVRGTVAKIALVPAGLSGVVLTSTLAGIRAGAGTLLPEVLYAYLRSAAGQAALSAHARSATGQIALTARDIRDIEVPVPPMEDQHRIAAIVRDLEAYEMAAGEALRARREIATQLTARLMTPD